MKAVVNIGYRVATITYSIKNIIVDKSQWEENFINYKMTQKSKNSKIICSHDIFFKDEDEWYSQILFDGRIIDFHYDYEERKEFSSKKDWSNYIFQGYEYIDGEPQLYDNNIVKQVVIAF